MGIRASLAQYPPPRPPLISCQFRLSCVPALISYHIRNALSQIHRARVMFHSKGIRGLMARWRRKPVQDQPLPLADHSIPLSAPRAACGEDGLHILWIDEQLPDPSRDSGSMRTFNLMRLMRTLGHAVHFLPMNGQCENRLARQLHDIGVVLPHGMTGVRLASAPAWLRRHGGDYAAIIVSRYHLAWSWLPFLRGAFPRALRILDTVDLHHLRESREAATKNNRLLAWAARGTRRRELAAASYADVTWVVSDSEKKLLADALPSACIRVVSNLHHPPASIPGHEQRRDLLFVGGAQHPPNVDAVHWLLTDIFPRVRRILPDCRLHLVGAGLREATAHLPMADGVHLHGHVPTLDSLLESSLVGLAPLRFGAGVKGKVNQYMAHGIPTVGTPMATEGMGLTHGVDVMVAEDADQFAAAIAQLHADPQLWRQISEHGLKNVSRHFSTEAATPEIVATLSGKRSAPAPMADRPENGTTH